MPYPVPVVAVPYAAKSLRHSSPAQATRIISFVPALASISAASGHSAPGGPLVAWTSALHQCLDRAL
jgi:hypothetical protein